MHHERSPETEALYRLLPTLKPGESKTFAELSAALQFDVLDFLSNLYRVRNSLKLKGIAVIEIVPKTGIRRLLDTEVINRHAPGQVRKSARAASRGIGGNASVDYAALAPADQTKHNATVAQLGAMRLFSRPKALKTIEAEAKPVFDPRATLALFTKK